MFLVLLVACGSTPDSFVEDYAAAMCAYQIPCGSLGNMTEAACIDLQEGEAREEYADCADDWDAGLAADCLAELEEHADSGECSSPDAPSCAALHCS